MFDHVGIYVAISSVLKFTITASWMAKQFVAFEEIDKQTHLFKIDSS